MHWSQFSMQCKIIDAIDWGLYTASSLFVPNKVLSFYRSKMIKKLINHRSERPSRVFAESLWFRLEVEHCWQGRHYQAPSWFPLVPSSTRSKLEEMPGEGWGVRWEGEELPRMKLTVLPRCKSLLYSRFTGFKVFIFNFGLSHVSKNILSHILIYGKTLTNF